MSVLIYLPTRNMWPHSLTKTLYFRLSIKSSFNTVLIYNYLITSELYIFSYFHFYIPFYNYPNHVFCKFFPWKFYRNYLFLLDIYTCCKQIYLTKFPVNIQSFLFYNGGIFNLDTVKFSVFYVLCIHVLNFFCISKS